MSAPVPAPQTARFQGMREALLAAAAQQFNEQGVRGATLGDIAASVGRVATSLTCCYRKKEDLATACFLRAIAAFDALAADAASDAASKTEHAPDGAHRAQVRRGLQWLNERFAGLLVDGLADRSSRPLHPAIAAQLLAANVNAAAELRRWVPGILAAEVTRRYTRPAMRGLLCAGAAPPAPAPDAQSASLPAGQMPRDTAPVGSASASAPRPRRR